MKLAVSAIAWTEEEEIQAFELLEKAGIKFVECVPARFLVDPVRFRRNLQSKGLRAVACQALLYGTQGLHLFESTESRKRLTAHFKKISKAASKVGARTLVFGSPKARFIDLDLMTLSTARKLAIVFFKELGSQVSEDGCVVCIEPNPPLYGCNFLTTSLEAFEFVSDVNTPGVELNIDLGTISINGEDSLKLMNATLETIGHLHISEPNLTPAAPFGLQAFHHNGLRSALGAVNYENLISIEMSRDQSFSWPEWSVVLKKSIEQVREFYALP